MTSNTRKFILQVGALMTGTTLANVVPIIVTPVLSRLYSPADFGVLALFVSLTTIFGSIANGRYELAIVLPKISAEAAAVTISAMFIAFGLAVVLIPPTIFINQPITELLKNTSISPWLYLLPLAVFIYGITNPLNYFHIRQERYKTIASAKIARALSIAAVQVYGGFKGWGGSGLILGFLVASLVESGVLLIKTRIESSLFRSVTFTEMKQQMKRYIRFPKFSVAGALSNTLSTNLMDVLIPAFFSTVLLGYYSLINRVLGMPLKMIGTSISQVYFQKAAEERNATGGTKQTFTQTMLLLLGVSVPIFLIIFFFIEDMFGLVFGAEWAVAGSYAKILLPLFFIRFVVSPIAVTFSIYEKQNIALLWQLSLLLSIIVVFLITHFYAFGFVSFLTMFTWLFVVLYLVVLAFVTKLSIFTPAESTAGEGS